ncbi:MAG: O-antigen ligase family protein [Chloroflexota bacterium]
MLLNTENNSIFYGRLGTIWLWLTTLGVLSLIALIGFSQPQLALQSYFLLGVLVPLGLLVWFKPEFGLVGLIFLCASIVQPDVVDIRLPIGGGLDLRDLVLIGLIGLALVRGLAWGTLSLPWIAVGGPLLLFLILAFISAANALVYENVPTNWAMNDLRILLYYSLFFLTAWNIQSLKQLSNLLLGLLCIANLTAAVVIIQQFRGADNLLFSSMEYGQWQVWAQEDGTVRVVPPGHVLIHFMMVVSFGLAIFNRDSLARRCIFGIQFLLLAVGQIFTFTRAGWVASFVSLLIVVCVFGIRYRRYLPQFFVVSLALFFVLGSGIGLAVEFDLVEFDYSSSIQERFATLLTPQETLNSYSLQWRLFEIEKASEAIRSNPLAGVSLGNAYRNITTFQGEASGLWTDGDLSAGTISRYTRYIHSSYISLATKMGIPGITAFLWFALSFIILGIGLYRRAKNIQMKALILTIVAGFIGLLQWSIFHAWLIETESTSVIGIMTGIVAALYAIHLKNEHIERNKTSNSLLSNIIGF